MVSSKSGTEIGGPSEDVKVTDRGQEQARTAREDPTRGGCQAQDGLMLRSSADKGTPISRESGLPYINWRHWIPEDAWVMVVRKAAEAGRASPRAHQLMRLDGGPERRRVEHSSQRPHASAVRSLTYGSHSRPSSTPAPRPPSPVRLESCCTRRATSLDSLFRGSSAILPYDPQHPSFTIS